MSRVGRSWRMLLAAAVVATVLLPSAPGVARAAEATFGTPTATVAYGKAIDFSVPIVTSGTLDRIELRLRFPASIGPDIVSVALPAASGSDVLRYQMDLEDGGYLAPNTRFEATWAAVASGRVVGTSTTLAVDYQDTTQDWRVRKGTLVTVHWYRGSTAFADRELQIAEQAVRETADLLGVTESERIDFFIYGDDAAFKAAVGATSGETTIGQARADIRTLFGLITEDTMDDEDTRSVVPHELAHLVFDTAVRNPFRSPPVWLNEGVATYLSAGYTPTFRGLVEGAARSGTLQPLTGIAGQFPVYDGTKRYLAYGTSVSAVDFLVRRFGKDKLVQVVRAYAEGLTDDEVFTRVLDEDMAAFQAAWLADVGADAPTRYGPQPAPPGPLPPGWSGPGQTPAPGSTAGAASPAPSGGATAVPGDGSSRGGTEPGPVLAAILGVFVVVVIGLVVARRRVAAA